ncbi:MAG: Bax inhibitor-1/YccA family protein [Clostridium sp.]|nr:Bax inhibitor-1/YccA family protein [Clostridium sp.]
MNEYSFEAGVSTSRMTSIMRRVYLKMTLALALTAFVSFLVSGSYDIMYFLATARGAMLGLFVVEIALVVWLTARLQKMSSLQASLLFFTYAAVTGVALSPIFLVYTGASLAKTFLITSGTFGAMSVYGYLTSRDLTSWGNFLFFALIGLIVCTLINLFTHSDMLQMVISAAGVLIFTGLTAYDTWKIRRWAEAAPGEESSKLATIGALSLYLDFINLFLYLLRFFGRRD